MSPRESPRVASVIDGSGSGRERETSTYLTPCPVHSKDKIAIVQY